LERAKEDIYFAQRDRELIEKLKNAIAQGRRCGVETPLPQRPTLGYIGEPDNSAFCVIERRDFQIQAA
jgi:hypothetical protein